ncbi:hypothetical protein ACFSTE_12315 [Aquimarina hainanensis]|uniref:Prenyltransferase n=1 Tax=Aquimarina hainanensis TaxID=1578017 RepID=A0ABW5N8L4_9FLAO|nr:hypothetical protein [Aquimarina sp. TRL1]QKX03793.1 hypothetical protein HN014_02280 [Aquimarina sp. TRL1]
MKTLKRIFDFYVNGSIHVAIAVCCLVVVTFMKYELPIDYQFLIFSFLGVIVAYNLVKYANVSKLYHKRLTGSMRGIRFLTIACAVLFLYYTFLMPLRTVVILVPFVLLTVLYAFPVFPNKKNLRSYAGVKIFIIGIVWAGVSVLMPIIHVRIAIDMDVLVETIQRFLFVVVMMMPFEVRDLQYDDEDLGTIPQMIGVTRAKVFGGVLLVFFLLLTGAKEELMSAEILSTISITAISLLFLWGTKKEQSEYFCSFWVESVPIMWLGILLVLR